MQFIMILMPYKYIFNVGHCIVKRGTCIIMYLIDSILRNMCYLTMLYIFTHLMMKYNLFISNIYEIIFKYFVMKIDRRSTLNSR